VLRRRRLLLTARHVVVSRSSLLRLLLAAGCWGLGTVVSKRAVAEIPPLTVLALQLASSVLVLSIAMRLRRVPLREPTESRILGRLGLLNPGIAYALSLLGLTSIAASLSVLLWTVEPVLILVLAAVVLGERVGARFIALSAVAAAGMALILYEPGIGGAAIGIVLTLAGVGCCAVYTVVARRFVGTADGTASVVLTQQVWALALSLVLLVALAATGGVVLPTAVSAWAWAAAAASGVVYYAAAYWSYLSALRDLPASMASTSFYVIPVFGVAFGAILLSERLSPAQWLGAAIVVGALVLLLRPAARVPAPAPVMSSSGVRTRP
jgi:drug/metabolite transporter (DMT)-like permease